MKTMTKTDKRAVAPAADNSQQTAVPRRYISPRVNIKETKDGYLLEAEMPGVNRGGLEISLEGNELTLVGRRAAEPQNLELLYRESNNADYRRMFELDPTIDRGRIEARIENGVLNLHLPKAEQVKPRKITVS
jgi:HSP20 family protein